MPLRRREVLRTAIATATVIGVCGCLGKTGDPAGEAHDAAEEFDHLREINAALDEGYRSRAAYVTADEGALGEVFVHRQAHEITDPDDLDTSEPTSLFYQLTTEGQYEAIGAGWSIAETDVSEPPSLFGQRFHGPDDHHVPGQSDHYGLHAWVFDDVDALFRPTNAAVTPPPFVPALEDVRTSLQQYQATADQNGADVALDDGYTNTEEHIFTDGGLYGVPFYNRDRRGINSAAPPILLYRMTDLWYYELMGAEWYIPAAETKDPPRLFEQHFHEPMDGHSPHTDQPEHYGLHAWLFRANPNGIFALYNPQFE